MMSNHGYGQSYPSQYPHYYPPQNSDPAQIPLQPPPYGYNPSASFNQQEYMVYPSPAAHSSSSGPLAPPISPQSQSLYSYPSPERVPLSSPYPPPETRYDSQQTSFHHPYSFHSGSYNYNEVYPPPLPPPPPGQYDISPGFHGQNSYAPMVDHFTNLHLSERQDNNVYATPQYLGPSSSFIYPSQSNDNNSSSHAYSNHSFSGDSYQSSSSFSGDLSHWSSAQTSKPHHSQQLVPSKASLKVLLLHGSLDIHIKDAKNLPNRDLFSKMFTETTKIQFSDKINKLGGHGSHPITSDPYVSFSISNAVLGRTFVIKNSENPVWNQHFLVPVAHYASEVCFLVKDNDFFGADLIGKVKIPVERIYSGGKFEDSYPILNLNGKQCKAGACLQLSIEYIPFQKLTRNNHGLSSNQECLGVPNTYFHLKKGGKVTLYQDAHVPEYFLPNLMLGTGAYYQHGKCWQDIVAAISQARRLIYITGWSVYHNVKLVRDLADGSGDTLGDLLKRKSQEGIRVLLLVWDDPTSRNLGFMSTDGLMGTNDEELNKYFKHSSVKVLLCPRSAGKRRSWIKSREVETIYTHHQKTVIVDADAGNGNRKIISFIGGLDLCKGRYDTPEHPLFKTLETVHKDDFHNPNFQAPNVSSPREPWHDLHCKIDGPASYDILCNFQERWNKASKRHGISKLKKGEDDALLKIERIPDILKEHKSLFLDANDPEAWHVQIFRSIDSSSVKGFPKDPKDATKMNLVCGKNVLIDMSIHTAYVNAIRAAQHFIYIENQYFIGSSYNWDSHSDIGANNLIPMEIALKITNKIKENERFSAYIVIPMWPEGIPTSMATQRILYWQNQTMKMMYKMIHKSLEEVGLDKTHHPQDYLNFFCLGNREPQERTSCEISSTENSPHALAQRNRRFMIYVHSKGMIVDDEYVIIGSANINQRSMEGTRDTEIAMGGYQPQHTWEYRKSHPFGQIYGYRMSLWVEHTGVIDQCFNQPESLECVRKIREISETNWNQFASDSVSDMKAHLLKYPIEVDRQGNVSPLRGFENFPDVGGKIFGTFFPVQENLTI